ncbi:MAG: ABC transporter ATP-binding protein [Coriobacteriales bacterium]|nr:ABC transporter ATP-binding protein [Coriobacteriales bacterium]
MVTFELAGVSKRYGKTYALKQFDAKFKNGLYGILGPNGAGKTTLVTIMVGLVAPTEGSILFNGQDTKKIKNSFLKRVGYLPQHLGFYRNYKAYEFLRYMAVVKGVPKQLISSRIDDLLETVNLTAERNKHLGSFSGGMLRRVGVAQAMLNNPDMLILDEPTSGLDPIERIRFRNLLTQLSEDRIVFLATHIVPDIEHIATEVVLLGGGKKLLQGSPAQLISSSRGYVWEVLAESESEVKKLSQHFHIGSAVRQNECYTLRIVSAIKPCAAAVSVLPTLEDVYLYHFGSQA